MGAENRLQGQQPFLKSCKSGFMTRDPADESNGLIIRAYRFNIRKLRPDSGLLPFQNFLDLPFVK